VVSFEILSSYSFLWLLTLGLEPKVPDCAGFQYMKLAFNLRSIPLNFCVNDTILTQNGKFQACGRRRD
jgi:hypothetical protein